MLTCSACQKFFELINGLTCESQYAKGTPEKLESLRSRLANVIPHTAYQLLHTREEGNKMGTRHFCDPEEEIKKVHEDIDAGTAETLRRAIRNLAYICQFLLNEQRENLGRIKRLADMIEPEIPNKVPESDRSTVAPEVADQGKTPEEMMQGVKQLLVESLNAKLMPKELTCLGAAVALLRYIVQVLLVAQRENTKEINRNQ